MVPRGGPGTNAGVGWGGQRSSGQAVGSRIELGGVVRSSWGP